MEIFSALTAMTHYNKIPSDQRRKNLHRVPRPLTDGTVRHHYYHRPTKIRLPAPDDPTFQVAYQAAERRYAEQQAAAPAPQAEDQSLAAAQAGPRPACLTTKLATQKSSGTITPRPPATAALRIRRRASVTQADIARIIRAAKKAGAAQIELRLNDSSSIFVTLQADIPLATDSEVVL